MYFVIGLAGVVALTVGTLLRANPLRTAWALVAASQAMWVVADLLWGVLDMTGRPTDASIADVLYVGGYVLLAVGLGSMLRSGTQDHDWGDIVDAGIITVSVALVLWPIVFEPTLELGWSAATLVRAGVLGRRRCVARAARGALLRGRSANGLLLPDGGGGIARFRGRSRL